MKILQVSLIVFAILIMGSIGYWKIEDYEFIDAVYMTVITLTTTGFREVRPLSENGKIFTIFLLLMGMGVVTYSISSIVSYITSIDFSKRRRDKMEKRINLFKNHTIVCGYGRMGEIICKRLEEENIPFVVIERRETLVQLLKQRSYHYIEGDAAHDEHLIKAGIERAKTLVSVIDNDADGLYIALAARSFNANLQIIVRAGEQNAKKRILRAGADKVILPFVMSGLKVAESIINPAVEDFLNIPDAQGAEGEPIQLADLYVTEESTIIGKELAEVGPLVKKIIIVGIRKKDHTFIFSPGGEYVFEIGDCLIAMGEQLAYKQTQEKFNLSTHTPHRNAV
jgi:voltage-gated potassium channel